MKKLILTFAVVCLAALAEASVTGYWQTIDDETGAPKSVVRVYEEGGLIFGAIVFTYNPEGAPNVVAAPNGAMQCNEAVKADAMAQTGQQAPAYCGLVIIKDLKPAKGGRYDGGTITDPKKNKIYKAEMWLEGAELIVRGKIAFLGRNQTWKPFTQAQLDAVLNP
ncbi:MAG: DUF2147 domain-containing protein [Elusimicrobiota bacterium]|jgi:uncharacterized protein (DUF2147 family)|nr:DUF2147 domain-containing protein [Elusimicrobiota bacterium]